MGQVGRHLDFAQEAVDPEGVGQLGVEDLEGDRTIMAEVARQEDGGHAAPTELALDDVAAGECRFQLRASVAAHLGPAASFSNRGFFRRGSNVGSMRSQAGDR